MKKLSIAIFLTIALVMALGTTAFAAQVLTDAVYSNYNNVPNTYEATAKNFTANGTTNYPYEIYLPNEEHPENYRIHSNYAKNTDACASCHATHTAVGASLLQWYSSYETCMACHDGTLGTATYNVLGGKIGTSTTPTFGGMFGTGNGSESSHNVTGILEIASAPGGTTVATEQVNGAHGTKNTRWINEFGCESCHSPHGQGGNARILHPDANYAASFAAEARTIPNKYYVSSTGAVYSDAGYTQAVYIIKGYPYSPSIQNGSVAETTYKIDNASGTSILVNKITGSPVTVDSAVYVLGVASLQVTMNIGHYLGLDGQSETVQHVYGMNAYCGACHTDYNTAAFSTTGSGGEMTGVYAQAHRHQMGMDWFSVTPGLKFESTKVAPTAAGSMECLTCHVAHGTSQDYWAATLGNTKGADGTSWAALGTDTSYAELSGSSALKRMPNMGTCEACHAKGEGNEGYLANSTGVNGKLSSIADITSEVANKTHEAFFAGGGYKDATSCLQCHTTAGDDFMKSVHWNVGSTSSSNKDFFGGEFKVQDSAVFSAANGFTNGMPFGMSDRFCGFPGGAAGVSFAYTFTGSAGGTQDGSSCGKCHPSVNQSMPPLFSDMMAQGQGASAAQIRQANLAKIDCLACHLATTDYDSLLNKVVTSTPQGNVFTYGNADHGDQANALHNTSFTLSKVGTAYQIQKPSNENCMTCHEHAMAGPVYKRHALFSNGTDVHASRGMECLDCHTTSKHLIAKGKQATDLVANDSPTTVVSCVASKCHTATPHTTATHGASAAKIAELNTHTAKLACQSCHVKTETNAYANAAMAYVNVTQAERGSVTRFTDNDLFKGGAIFNDFRLFGDTYTISDDIQGQVYGFLGTTNETGRSEYMMAQPGNFAWRWFNGTGTGMANAIASFGFYDPYYFNDGFAGFRGTTTLPAPWGFGKSPDGTLNNQYLVGMGMPADSDFSGPGMASLFGMYWGSYANPDMFLGSNPFDNELYAGAPKGGQGDKIYPFRKMQAWMPVPRTNFWFLTPHDLGTLKNGDLATVNYESLKNAIESPMMYMFFSEMFKPAMDLYAQEFGFQYMFTPVTVANYNIPGTHPQGYDMLVGGMGMMAGGLQKLNGYIYDTNGFWLDNNARTGSKAAAVDLTHVDTTGIRGGGNVSGKPSNATEGQDWLLAGQLDTYMYFPMPLDANIMEDHAVAAKGFTTTEAAQYEPRTCNECHRAPNNPSGSEVTTFDNPDWNPLGPAGAPMSDNEEWGKNFVGTVNTVGASGTSVIDWKALGYTNQEITDFTTNTAKYGIDWQATPMN